MDAHGSAAHPGVSLSTGATEIYECGGRHYHLLGYVWDHEVKDFKVLYRTLYECGAKAGCYEAHALAVSTFERWQARFRRVELDSLPSDVVTALRDPVLQGGPPALVGGAQAAQVTPSRACTASGHGTRSFEATTLAMIIGDHKRFIDVLLSKVQPVIDVSKFEMDHICYRCESEEEYKRVCGALCSSFGDMLTVSNINGRPIATIRLHSPICHAGFEVTCVEVPCPKPGRPYKSGLEHAEFVVGSPEDGMHKRRRLTEFVSEHPDCAFDQSAIEKEINADVSLNFDTELGPIVAKFHQRPLYEVIAFELKHI